jgi:hypothetical protein
VGWKARVPLLAASLWWGSLSAIGFLVVPLLFAHLPTAALAGQMAAKLFTAQTWITTACGVFMMMSARAGPEPAGIGWQHGALAFVFAGVLLALLTEFAVAPRIVARENLRLWHAVGTAMYALQWICALVVLCKLSRQDGRAGFPPPRE